VKEIAIQVLDTKAETVEALLETNLPDGKSVDQRVKALIVGNLHYEQRSQFQN
jgi:elongation factor Ts